MRHSLLVATMWVAVVLATSTPAWAVDGVLEINQTCATQTGCFAGDVAGFPVTIGTAGSYVLTSSLAMTAGPGNGIEVGVDGVTIDMNGFEIAGPITCTGSGSGLVCSNPTGVGLGIDAPSRSRIIVRNGTIRGMGAGVAVGAHSLVVDVMAIRNDGTGIQVADGSIVIRSFARWNDNVGILASTATIVSRSAADRNRANGLFAFTGCVVRDSRFQDNGGNGIATLDGCVVSENHAEANGGSAGISVGSAALVLDNQTESNGVGIQAGAGSAVRRNVLRDLDALSLAASATFRENLVDGARSGGIDMGANACANTASCP